MEDTFGTVLARKDNMKIQRQYDNTQIPNLGLLHDNTGVEHLWDISSSVAQAKEDHQIPSECRGLAFCCNGERCVWYAQSEVPMPYSAQN